MKKYKFYDTSSLLLKANTLFDDKEDFAISSITLEELENIKTSTNKDPDIKYSARKLLHILDEHSNEYDIHIFTQDMLDPIEAHSLSITNDTKILATALDYAGLRSLDKVVFITNDLCLKSLARTFFNQENIESVNEDIEDDYDGYIDKTMTNEEMEYFYSNQKVNTLNALINQYILIRNEEGKVVDWLVWLGDGYRQVSYDNLDSRHFGRITLLKGKAGTGKSYLAFGYLFNQLEKNRISKIIIFCNTVAAKNSARLGYYPGSRNEKLLDSQIGNLLISKIGGRDEVVRLIDEEKLVLLPMSDIRGYDTTGMDAGVYIAEAQNLDISLMKLALQRIGDDAFCIIDGDVKTQVDDIAFAGANNGMRRASKVFRGHECYGEITLQQIHRSEIAKIAELM